MSDIVLSTLWALIYLTTKIIIKSTLHYNPHIADEKTEAQRGYVTCPKKDSHLLRNAANNDEACKLMEDKGTAQSQH